MKSKFQKIKGTYDILPDESRVWRKVENIIHSLCEQFSFEEIRTPIIEKSNLFNQNLGNNTDVQKEMFSWKDISGEDIVLKPEMTAAVVRAYLENGLFRSKPFSKLYYIDSFFRREKPQKGRQRQFHQFGVEVLGGDKKGSDQDAEIILIASKLIKKLKIKNTQLLINNIGTPEERKKWSDELKDYFTKHKTSLSKISQQRLERNPLRILDSKEPEDKQIIEDSPKFISDDKYEINKFAKLQENLNALNISYKIDPFLIRGLDYYNGNVFEITANVKKSQNALCGGGRYDFLVENMKGPSTPAVGFAAGIERLIMFSNLEDNKNEIDAYIICKHADEYEKTLQLIENLVDKKYKIYFATRWDKLKIERAVKMNAKFAIQVGKEYYWALDLKKKNSQRIQEKEIGVFLKKLNFQ